MRGTNQSISSDDDELTIGGMSSLAPSSDSRCRNTTSELPKETATVKDFQSHTLPTAAQLRRPDSDFDFLSPPQKAGELGRLGDYRVLSVLGQGGMGLVFRAEDERLRRQVAIKVMRLTVAHDPHARIRFLREAQAVAAIEHDNVIGIFQAGEMNKTPFFTMPLLKGESLKTRLNRDGRLSERDSLRIASQVATALAAAHASGVLHRDIKPDNIWLESKTDRVKVLDFGLAQVASADPELTQTGSVLGTPLYMSPEQARGEELDARSDLYSLGAVLFHMLTGCPVVSGPSVLAILMDIASEVALPLRSLPDDVGTGAAQLVARLLSKSRESRPASAAEAAKQIGAIIKQRRSRAMIAMETTLLPWRASPGSGLVFGVGEG